MAARKLCGLLCPASLDGPSQRAGRKETWQGVLESSTDHRVFQGVQVAFCILPEGDPPLPEYGDIPVSESLYFLHEPAIPYFKLKTEAT